MYQLAILNKDVVLMEDKLLESLNDDINPNQEYLLHPILNNASTNFYNTFI